jgi:hypothetical protein
MYCKTPATQDNIPISKLALTVQKSRTDEAFASFVDADKSLK